MADPLIWRRWEEVDRLLEAALDRPVKERAAWLRESTAGDATLCNLVLGLLARLNEESDERLSGPAESVVLGAFPGAEDVAVFEDLVPGTLVGRYVIGERLGRGGMATVYAAQRADGTYQQRVALKVLRRGLDTEDLVRRFRNERQILSALVHPNIARLLDGGSLADGRPFLVMELVEGVPITAHADTARLGLRERLSLFLQVVDAVRAAHRRLVVHRDIKPANILVDTDGRVKLLDFGIAKLLEAEGGITEGGLRALTPDYASPEQLSGDPITTGTDVYQLGLLLRELVSGLPPLAGAAHPGDAPLRASRAVRLSLDGLPAPEVRAALRRTTAARLAKALGGDLDLILGVALRRDPDERYASANELAADVRAWLEGRPVHAHPESAAYRMRKLVGRHPFLLPGAAAVLLGLSAFIVVLRVQGARVERERDAAEVASQRAMATQAFLVDLLRSPDPTESANQGGRRDITVVEALQRGRARIATELADQPEVRAAVLEAIGRSLSGLGRYEMADTLLREALQVAVGQDGATPERRFELLRAIASNHKDAREFQHADTAFSEALKWYHQSHGVPDTALAALLGSLSGIRRELGDLDSAITLAGRAVALQRASGDTVGARFTSALGSLAFALRGANHLDSAEAVYRDVLRRQQQDGVPHPASVAVTYNNLGYLLKTRGDLAGAEEAYREAYRLARSVLGEGHPGTRTYGNNLASALELEGKLDEVVEIAHASIAAAEREWPRGHWRVGAAYAALGRFFLRHGRASEAIAPLGAAVRSYEATLGARHDWTLVAAVQLGTAQLVAGQRERGAALLDRALAALRQGQRTLDADSRLYLGRTATQLTASGHGDRAEALRALLPD